MTPLPELEKRYPVLMGRSVVIIDAPRSVSDLYAYLSVIQQMKVDYLEEVDFPNDLAGYMKARKLESSIIHVPNVATSEVANTYKRNVYRGYEQQPRMIILEAYPINRETIEMYEDFRRAGIPMAGKFSKAKVIGKLAELFG